MTDNPPLLPLLLGLVPIGLRRALDQEGILHAGHAQAPRAGRFVLFDSAFGGPAIEPGQVGIDLAELGANARALCAAIADERSARIQWRIGAFELSEEVARFDKRSARAELMGGLRRVVEAAGGVWLKLAAFPFPYRSGFNLRIDHDEYDAADFERLMQAIEGREEFVSHYVCGSAYERRDDALARLKGMHVGSHGFRHHTYVDAAENRRNIERGIDALVAHGIDPIGFVAPHGRFPAGMAETFHDLKIDHSGEFALAYDELPFLPRGSSSLQIPIHPICLGLFLEAARNRGTPEDAAADQAADYFERLIASRHESGEPAFVYCHPDGRLGRYPHVVRRILSSAASHSAMWKTTLAQVARWWRARSAVRLRVVRDGSAFVVRSEGLPRNFRLGVELWREGRFALVPIDGPHCRIVPAALTFEGREPPTPTYRTQSASTTPFKQRVLRYLDWEHVTPWREVGGSTWKGRIKRTLKRWHAHTRVGGDP